MDLHTGLLDPEPELRILTGTLLLELNDPELGARVAMLLPSEHSLDASEAFILILRAKPDADSFEPLLQRLPEVSLSGPAAEALWALLQEDLLLPAQTAELRAATGALLETHHSPALARLMAATGLEGELLALGMQLAEVDDTMAAAIAEGFLHLERRDLLLPHASRSAIMPYAIRSFHADPMDTGVFQDLLDLQPDEAYRELWLSVMRSSLRRLGAGEIMTCVELLHDRDHVTEDVRKTILLDLVTTPPADLAVDMHAALLGKVIPLLISAGDALQGLELLLAFEDVAATPSLAEAHLDLALLSGYFDLAFELNPDPASWMDRIEKWADAWPDAMRAAADEIGKERFSPQINELLLLRYHALRDTLGMGSTTQPPQPGNEDDEESGQAGRGQGRG